MYRVDIMTLFDLTVGDVLSESILGRAQERGYIKIETHQSGTTPSISKSRWTTTPMAAGGRGDAGRPPLSVLEAHL